MPDGLEQVWLLELFVLVRISRIFSLIENSFHFEQRSENMSDCFLGPQNRNQIKSLFFFFKVRPPFD